MNYTNPLMVGVNEFGFDFAFKIDNPMPPDIGTMILYKEVDHRIVDNVTQQHIDFIVDLRELETVECGTTNLNYSDPDEILRKGFDSYACLKNKSEMQLGGTFFDDIYSLMNIRIFACVNSSDNNITCASPEDQATFFGNNALEVIIKN